MDCRSSKFFKQQRHHVAALVANSSSRPTLNFPREISIRAWPSLKNKFIQNTLSVDAHASERHRDVHLHTVLSIGSSRCYTLNQTQPTQRLNESHSGQIKIVRQNIYPALLGWIHSRSQFQKQWHIACGWSFPTIVRERPPRPRRDPLFGTLVAPVMLLRNDY